MIILGMTGPIGHGKTTFADALSKLISPTVHLESSNIVIEVANKLQQATSSLPDPTQVDSLNNWLHPLPGILKETVHTDCTFEDIRLNKKQMESHPVEYQKLILHIENLKRYPQMLQTEITPENKEGYRPLLQFLGGYLVSRIDSGIWFKEIARRIQLVEKAGCALCIVGGLRYPTDAVILRSVGGIILEIHRPGFLQSDLMDPTERERQSIAFDCTISSDGTVEDIQNFAERFLQDLHADQLQKVYHTKS